VGRRNVIYGHGLGCGCMVVIFSIFNRCIKDYNIIIFAGFEKICLSRILQQIQLQAQFIGQGNEKFFEFIAPLALQWNK
jgi:hypothetical protein